jgi:hypothetical protein
MIHRLKVQTYRMLKLLRALSIKKKYDVSELLFDNSTVADQIQWICHDERWERIIHRFDDRRMLLNGVHIERDDNPQELTDDVEFRKDGTIKFNGSTENEQEWLYLHLDPNQYPWDNYRMTFQFKRETDFRELQFGLRYQDFFNRYRYRFENNRIYFDKVVNGRFYNGFSVTPFPMQLGRSYRITLDVFDNTFKCFVDDKLMSFDYDFSNEFPKGPVAIILWEDDSCTHIKGSLSSFQVHELKKI